MHFAVAFGKTAPRSVDNSTFIVLAAVGTACSFRRFGARQFFASAGPHGPSSLRPRDRSPATLAPDSPAGGGMRNKIPVLGLVFLLGACRESSPPLGPAPAGAPRFNTSPGDGLHGAIAFHSSRDGDFEIFAMNADGSDVTQLTHNNVHEFDPIWSPNGKRILFSRLTENGDFELVVINADGTGETQLTNNAVNDFAGAWSPDGKQIAFAREVEGEDAEIFIMNVDGSDTRQLTNNTFRDFVTSWSRNGKQLLFESDRDGDPELDVMNVDGST